MLINPRPGVVVAIANKRGEIVCYDPNAYRRRDYVRIQKILEDERKEDGNAQGETAH